MERRKRTEVADGALGGNKAKKLYGFMVLRRKLYQLACNNSFISYPCSYRRRTSQENRFSTLKRIEQAG